MKGSHKVFLLGIGLLLIAGAIALTESTQVKSWLRIDKNYDCTNTTYDVFEATPINITRSRDTFQLCQDFSTENLSLYEHYCKTGTENYTSFETKYELVQKQVELCKEDFYIINTSTEIRKLTYNQFGKCSFTETAEGAIISCDSRHDGNGDGVCKSGESCCTYNVTQSGITSRCNLETEFVQGLKPMEVSP